MCFLFYLFVTVLLLVSHVDNRRWHMPICEMNTNHRAKWNITYHYRNISFFLSLFLTLSHSISLPLLLTLSCHMTLRYLVPFRFFLLVFLTFFGFLLEFSHENGRVSSASSIYNDVYECFIKQKKRFFLFF